MQPKDLRDIVERSRQTVADLEARPVSPDSAHAPRPPHTDLPTAPEEPERSIWGNLLIAALFIGSLFMIDWSSFVPTAPTKPPEVRFSDAEILRIKQMIRDKFETDRRQTQVIRVELVRESSRKLTGFAVLRDTRTNIESMLQCSATMSDDGENFIWHCN